LTLRSGVRGFAYVSDANSALPSVSWRLSGANNESWNAVESCHSALRCARRVATVLAS